MMIKDGEFTGVVCARAGTGFACEFTCRLSKMPPEKPERCRAEQQSIGT
jgi:hypothetical protein